MNETPWFLPTDTPVRVGVYKTKHLSSDRSVVEGYSNWTGKFWSYTCGTAREASTYNGRSVLQSKAWCGLTEETK